MIVLLRVDNRLLHGQILEAWVPRLKANRVVVADDEAAASPLAKAAMTLCLPPHLAASVEPLAEVDWAALAGSTERVIVLVREVEGLVRAVEHGLDSARVAEVNLGNVHHAPGRVAVTPSVFLSADEAAGVRKVVAAGFTVGARAVPTEPGLDAPEILRRLAAHGR